MLRRDLTGQLSLVPLVVESVDVRDAGTAQNVVDRLIEFSTCSEEPEPIPQDESTQGRFVLLAQSAHIFWLRSARDRINEYRFLGPGRIGEAGAQQAGKLVPAGLREGVDDAAGEAAVLRRNAPGEKRGLLNRIFNEEIFRVASNGVVDP